MRARSARIAAVLCLIALVDVNSAEALNEPTHEVINEQAARQTRPETPGLDQILKEQLGFPAGIEQPIRGRDTTRRVFQWLRRGGTLEDEGMDFGNLTGTNRYFRHFHDPLLPWDRSGLFYLPLLTRFESSIHWMQRRDQGSVSGGTGNWSWQDARRYFHDALTVSDPGVREQAFADTFRALGQIMHLVVDASVPEHTRNDPHPMETACRRLGWSCFGNYEYWVSDRHNGFRDDGTEEAAEESNFIGRFLSNPISFDASILQQPTKDAQAPVPVARLIDTDTYQGTDPNVTLGPAIGIAEFANANFFSENTGSPRLFSPNYPFPDRSRLVPSELPAPQPGRVRAYYAKAAGDGLPVDPVLAECVFDEPARRDEALELRTYVCVDDNVWATVAQHMLPRAVGYSAGLLDYFFRGKLDVALVEGAGGASGLDLQVTNRSPDPLGPGKLTLYTEDANGLRREVAGASRNLETAVPQHEDLPGLPITLPAGDPERFVAVFEGTLGQEQGAVIGQVLDTRLEQVLEITGGWVLRTADRVYWLPFEEFLPETQHFVLEVKWGARETTLGVWSIMASDQQIFEDAFSVFELTRLPGTQGVQTTGALRDGLPVAKLTLVRTVPLSALHGLPLGTTVTLEHTHRRTNHRADLVTTTHVHFIPGEKEGQGVCAFDAPSSSFTVVPNGTFQETYDQTFPLVLDTRPNLCPGPEGESCPLFYSWAWEDFTVTETGDILLLISLNQGVLPNIHRQVQGQRHAPSGILVPSSGGSVTFSFPHEDYEEQVRGPLLGDLPFLAWVNLSQRTLLAKSMADAVTLRHTTVDGALAADLGRITFSDHPTCGPTKDEVWQPFVFNFFNFCQESESCRPSAGAQVTEVRTDRGTETLGLVGLYGAPFAGLGLDQFTFSDSQTVHYLRLDPEKAVRFVLTHHRLGQAPWRPAEIPDIFFANARRGEQAVAGLPIVFGRPSPGPFTGLGPDPEGRLVLWDGRPRGLARSLLQTATPLFEPLANQRWALVGSFDLTGPIAYLVALDGSANLRVPVEHLPNVFFSDGFTLLEPRALYNAHEGKFYAIGPSLRRMVLPLKPLQPVDPTLDPLYVDGAWWPYQIVGPR